MENTIKQPMDLQSLLRRLKKEMKKNPDLFQSALKQLKEEEAGGWRILGRSSFMNRLDYLRQEKENHPELFQLALEQMKI